MKNQVLNVKNCKLTIIKEQDLFCMQARKFSPASYVRVTIAF